MNQIKQSLRAVIGSIWFPAIMAVALLLFSSAASSLNKDRTKEDIQRMEDALRRSCVACYAIEGRYPPDVEYIKDHYGLQIDQTHYTVYYQIFAENILPDIAVFEKRS